METLKIINKIVMRSVPQLSRTQIRTISIVAVVVTETVWVLGNLSIVESFKQQIMNKIDTIKKQLQEVNRDIEGMLSNDVASEKKQKTLKDAREYRESLEEDLLLAVREEKREKCKSDEPVIIGVMIIGVN